MVTSTKVVARAKQQKSAKSSPKKLAYGGNPKHQEPWQRGRKGSICHKNDLLKAQGLLNTSVLIGRNRWSTDGERAYSGKQDGHGEWHGYPVGWLEVPNDLRHQWQDSGRVRRRSIMRHWRRHEE